MIRWRGVKMNTLTSEPTLCATSVFDVHFPETAHNEAFFRIVLRHRAPGHLLRFLR